MPSLPVAVGPLAEPVNAPTTSRAAPFDYTTWLIALTVARLAFIPLLIASFMMAPVVTTAALVAFVGLDVYDGVLARRLGADGLRRRALDSTVDRVAIDGCLIGAWAVGALPTLLLVALLARDAYCAVICARMMSHRRTAIKADWLYRSLNLSVAAWAIAAPFAGATGRTVAAVAVLLFSLVVAADLTKLVRAVLHAPAHVHHTVVAAATARSCQF